MLPFTLPTSSFPSILLTIPHTPPDPLLKLLPILPPHFPRLDIGRTLIVRTTQHTDHAQQNRLGSLHGTPSLAGALITVLVVFGRVQDADADFAIGVDVGVENGSFEFEFGRLVRIFGGELETSAEYASCGWGESY